MTRDNVREIIYEALVMYIDDTSMIGKVTVPKQLQNIADDSVLKVTLKNGDSFRLIVTPDVIRLSE